MTVVYDLFVVVHLLGMASLVGGWFAVLPELRASKLMVWGARAQLVTGVVLVGLAEGVSSLDRMVDHNKVGLKLLVSVAVLAFIEIAHSRQGKNRPEPGLVSAAGYLAVLNVIIAAVWH